LSQAGIINVSGGGGGGAPIETITGDTGGAVPPTANNINLLGGNSSANNTLGITFAGNPGTSTITGTLTNRATGTASTVSAPDVETLITFPLADNTVYQITVDIVGRATNKLGNVSAHETGLFYREGGGGATITGTVDSSQELKNLAPFLAYTSVSGNNVVVQAFGTATYNVNWYAVLTFIQVS